MKRKVFLVSFGFLLLTIAASALMFMSDSPLLNAIGAGLSINLAWLVFGIILPACLVAWFASRNIPRGQMTEDEER